MKVDQFGILTSIDWNSNSWKDLPTDADIQHSNFGYVEQNNLTHTYLNFGHLDFPSDEKGNFYVLLPQFWSKTPQAKDVKVIIVKSQNWESKKNFIVGLYILPKFERKSLPSFIEGAPNREVNIKVLPENMHLLEHYIELNSKNEKLFLPKGKEVGKQGFNYLTKFNVLKILDEMTFRNPQDRRLSSIKFRVLKNLC